MAASLKVGSVVVVKNARESNGSREHPAIVNRVWNPGCINVTVFPDCGSPYALTSLQSMADFPSDEYPRFVAVE